MVKREIQAQEYASSVRGYVTRAAFWVLEKLAYAAPAAAFAGGCGDDGSGGPVYNPYNPPVAVVYVDQTQGPKPHTVTIDASASLGGTVHIDPGDGSPIETEVLGVSASDGNPDGIRQHTYTQEGDYTVEAIAENSAGELSDPDAEEVDVGFGPDRQGALDYIEAYLTNEGYNCTQGQDFQVFNPVTYGMTAYNGLKAELSDEILYFLYDSSNLTQEQLDTIAARASEGMDMPRIITIEPDQSPNTIDDLLDNL